jgi:hypothetical protein
MVTLLLAATLQTLNVEIVKRSDLAKGFVVLPAVPWPPPHPPHAEAASGDAANPENPRLVSIITSLGHTISAPLFEHW